MKLNVGDEVIVVRSPYESVPNGTKTKITGLYTKHNRKIYILGDQPNKLFRYKELKKVEDGANAKSND